MGIGNLDERRLAFGRVADLYERARPAYPQAVIDELITYAQLEPGARVLEIGSGTGKASRMLAERGLTLHCLEPAAEMAAIGRQRCAEFPCVEVEQRTFEDWRPGTPFAALVCAQAWHWITPEVRYLRASEALGPDGTLACIWTFPNWSNARLGDALRDAYHEAAPELAADFPMHPASRPSDLAGDWQREIDASKLFSDPEIRRVAWSLRYTTTAYLELLQTHQDHILLEDEQRHALFAAVARVTDRADGGITLDLVTRLCLARRS